MSTLQFTLFFLALLVGYALVHLRLVRFEEHLQKLAGIRSIDDRLRSLDEHLRQLLQAFEKVQLERVEQRLDRLHEDLEDLREATTDVRSAVVQIPATLETWSARLRGLVESRLLQLGYGNLRILTELADAPADRDVEVQVECERNHMPCKGRVLVRNGSVRDVAMQPVAQMFP